MRVIVNPSGPKPLTIDDVVLGSAFEVYSSGNTYMRVESNRLVNLKTGYLTTVGDVRGNAVRIFSEMELR